MNDFCAKRYELLVSTAKLKAESPSFDTMLTFAPPLINGSAICGRSEKMNEINTKMSNF